MVCKDMETAESELKSIALELIGGAKLFGRLSAPLRESWPNTLIGAKPLMLNARLLATTQANR
jgi:hypothetical protein